MAVKQRILDTGNQIAVSSPHPHVASNRFDLSCDVKLSCQMGRLIPLKVREVLPGDQWTQEPELLVRMQPMIAPVMHRFTSRTETFFVANRLLYEDWANFIAPPTNNGTTYVLPYWDTITVGANSVGNYIGLPIGDLTDVCALQHAAYHKVYSDWYRDVVLDPIPFDILPSGVLSGTNKTKMEFFHNRNFDRDYFTSARPEAQNGPAVVIPSLTTPAPVTLSPIVPSSSAKWRTAAAHAAPVNGPVQVLTGDVTANGGVPIVYDPQGSLEVTPASIGLHGGTIEELRRASKLQEFLESETSGGTTYADNTYAHFAVHSSDLRAQRSEFLGGTSQPMVIGEVLNTTGETDGLPQGNMAGHGVSHGTHGATHYRAEEHGFLVTIMTIMPETGYSSGLPKQFSRKDRFDFAWPEFAQLGYQEIKRQELVFMTGADAAGNKDPFGYVPRYTEYRMDFNRVCGDFSTNLTFWHDARIYETLAPALNINFIQCDAANQGLNRIFAVVDDVQHFLVQAYFKTKVWRCLPRLVHPTL